MDGVWEPHEEIIRCAARRLKGHQRRLFMAEATEALCHGSARQAEERFGGGAKRSGKGCVNSSKEFVAWRISRAEHARAGKSSIPSWQRTFAPWWSRTRKRIRN